MAYLSGSHAIGQALQDAERWRQKQNDDRGFPLNPGGPVPTLAWQAFFGAQDRQAEQAAAQGLDYRMNLGSIGRNIQNGQHEDSMGQFSLQPGGDLTQRTIDINRYLSDDAQRFRLGQAAQREAAARAQAAEDAVQNAQSDRASLDYALRDPSLPRETVLKMVPGRLRPQVEDFYAKQDADAAALAQHAATTKLTEAQTATIPAKQKLEEEKFKATYGTGLDENGQPMASPVAKQIAEYRLPPPSPRSIQTDAGRGLMAQVNALNPSFDATQYPTRAAMRKAFTSGPQAQALNSLNTAIVHLDQFAELAKGLDNGSFQSSNAVKNWIKTEFGSSAPTNFDGMRTILSGELAAAFKKSGATDPEIANVQSTIARKESPAQLSDYVIKIAIPALGSKAGTYQDQWRQTMGEKDPYSVYTPSAKAVLDKYGAGHGPVVQSGKSGDPLGIR